MSRLPQLSLLELVLIGFLGEKDPQNKPVPDPKADSLPKGVLEHCMEDDASRKVFVRCVGGTLQDALQKELKSVENGCAGVATEGASAAPEASEAAASGDTVASTAAAAAAKDVTDEGCTTAAAKSEESGQEQEPPSKESGQEQEPPSNEASSPEPIAPSVCFIAHPHLHRYFSDFYPAIKWLIDRKVPTIVIGSSEPDLSWKQDEILLKALGAEIVVSKRESPYPMCLPDNAKVKKCNHVIGFCGGKALERDKLTRTKIDLLAQDYTVC